MRKLIALIFLTITCLANADTMIDTADFKLDLIGDWELVQSTDPDQHAYYSKEKDVAITASSMRFKKGLPDLHRFADKLIEVRMVAENDAAKKKRPSDDYSRTCDSAIRPRISSGILRPRQQKPTVQISGRRDRWTYRQHIHRVEGKKSAGT
jgi:hypothetical protein